MNTNLMFQPLQKYAVFQGRASRTEYWLWFLFMVAVAFVFYILEVLTGGRPHMDPATFRMVMPTGLGMGIYVLQIVFNLAVLIPGLAVAVRRLHDTNRSGWWILIGLIPLIGAVVLLIFFLIDSTPGTNRFGPNPKGAGDATETFA
ncbi:MAG: hypothetical protein JWM33_1831 [Caulobacteraceae bacterium]|nr:hypothetical protein [Caulobacteraceae bacterium]